MFKSFQIVLIVLLFTGCQSTQNTQTSNIPSALEGVIQGSLTWSADNPAFTRLEFKFRSLSDGKSYSVVARPTFNVFYGQTVADVKTGEVTGMTFSQTLPVGEYEFYNYRMDEGGQFIWSSPTDYAIPFNVLAQQASYLGEIRIYPKVKDDGFGGTEIVDGTWILSDQANRDMPLLQSRYPHLAQVPVTTAIPQKKSRYTSKVLLPSEKKD